MKRIAILCILLLMLTSPALAETISRVAAIINDEIITTYQLEKAVAEERKANNLGELSATVLQRLRSQLLERMIDEKLLTQRTKELGITVQDDELEAAVSDVQNQNNLTREQLINALSAQGMDFEVYRENLRQEILRYKLIGREVNSKVEVTNKQIQQYFEEHSDDYKVDPTVHLKRISLNIPEGATEQQRAAVNDLAEAVREKLTVEKEPFDAVLASLGNSADGDDMGALEEEALLPVFQEALRGLKIGEVSTPVEAAGRLHLFFVADRNSGEATLSDENKEMIEQLLRKENTEKRFNEWAAELREQAHVKILL